MLESEEQRLFRALSVFAGGCTYEAAEAVCGADPDTLQSLLDKSLIRRREEGGGPRYWMLETILELAAEHLRTAAEDAEVRRLHAEHYLEVARSAHLAADVEGEQRHDLVIHEHDNMRAALSWAAETADQTLGLELVVALENYWATASPEEGLEWAVTLLAGADRAGGVDPGLVARALRVQGGMQNVVGHVDESDASWEQALRSPVGSVTTGPWRPSCTGSRALRYDGGIRVAFASLPRRASKVTVAPALFRRARRRP